MQMENLKKRLEKGGLTKVIMGLGNTSIEQIKALGAICSEAKADIFDLTPDKKVFDAIKEGILSQGKNPDDYFYCVDKDELHAMHVQMIQKHQREIESLQCKIKELERKIS